MIAHVVANSFIHFLSSLHLNINSLYQSDTDTALTLFYCYLFVSLKSLCYFNTDDNWCFHHAVIRVFWYRV